MLSETTAVDRYSTHRAYRKHQSGEVWPSSGYLTVNAHFEFRQLFHRLLVADIFGQGDRNGQSCVSCLGK